MSAPPENDTVDVTLPLRARHASVLRTIAATLGADIGFSVDEIDDLRLGLSEVFTILVDAADTDAARVTVRFRLDDDALAVVAEPAGAAGRPVEIDPLAGSILDSVLDDFEVTADGVRLVKRATERRVGSVASPSDDR
jgi:serine/threonine-protein kinase RsbW